MNSGLGKRMGRLTAGKPKCLVNINGDDTVLSRQIRQLLRVNINDILITTGPFEGMIEDYLHERFPDNNFEYIRNPRYEETNYIYSLLLASGYIKGDILLLHGDLVFEDTVLAKILDCKRENCVLVKRDTALPEKDFKGKLNHGRVVEISVEIFGGNCLPLMPFYKLNYEAAVRWLEEMEKYGKAGRLTVYAEDALNDILGEDIQLYPVYYTGEICMEVDDPLDLRMARSKIGGSKG